MENYLFKLLNGDGAVLDIQAGTHAGLSAVWAEIARLARRPDMTVGHIVVTNQSGEVLILVGAATARSYPLTRQDAKSQAAASEAAIFAQSGRGGGSIFNSEPQRRMA
jgi:hypothetical protein